MYHIIYVHRTTGSPLQHIQGGPKNGTKFVYANNFIKY